MGVYQPRPFGWNNILDKKIQNSLEYIFNSYSICKNNHAKILNHFASGNFSKIKLKSGCGPATPLWVLNHARQNVQKQFRLIPTQWIKNHAKIFNSFLVVIF